MRLVIIRFFWIKIKKGVTKNAILSLKDWKTNFVVILKIITFNLTIPNFVQRISSLLLKGTDSLP